MSDWKVFQLGDISESCLGKMLDKRKNKGVYQPYLSNKCVRWGYFDFDYISVMKFEDHEKDRYGIIAGDLIICEGGEPGRCAIWRNEIPGMKIQKALHRLRVKDGFSTEFLYYRFLLAGRTNFLDKYLIGSTIKHLTGIKLKSIEFTFPEFKNQQAIAKVLADLDAKIALNNKINAQLESMARLLYEYWFVQFDFPDAEGKPYKSSGGNMVYNEQLKREIPEGWEADCLAAWIKNEKNGDWGKDSVQGNYKKKVNCIRGADINGLNGQGSIKAPVRYILEKNSHKILEDGDLVVEISGGSPTQSTGRLAFITSATRSRFDTDLICSNFCKAITLKRKESLFTFVHTWNRLYNAGVLFDWEGKTSGIKNLLFDAFVAKFEVPQPPVELMEIFNDSVKPLHDKIQTNLKQNQQLAALRDWLLPMLMNGQVRVEEEKVAAV